MVCGVWFPHFLGLCTWIDGADAARLPAGPRRSKRGGRWQALSMTQPDPSTPSPHSTTIINSYLIQPQRHQGPTLGAFTAKQTLSTVSMGRLRSSTGGSAGSAGSGAGGKRRLVGGGSGTGGSSTGSKRGRLLAVSVGAVGGRGSKGAAVTGVGGIGGWMGRQAPVEEEEEEPLAALASLEQLVAVDGEEEEEIGPTLSLETLNANVLSVVLGFLSAAEAERLAGACRALRTQVRATTMTDRPDLHTLNPYQPHQSTPQTERLPRLRALLPPPRPGGERDPRRPPRRPPTPPPAGAGAAASKARDEQRRRRPDHQQQPPHARARGVAPPPRQGRRRRGGGTPAGGRYPPAARPAPAPFPRPHSLLRLLRLLLLHHLLPPPPPPPQRGQQRWEPHPEPRQPQAAAGPLQASSVDASHPVLSAAADAAPGPPPAHAQGPYGAGRQGNVGAHMWMWGGVGC